MTPTTTQPCICCGRLATHPVGVCDLCLPIIHAIQSAHDLHPYEQAALQFAIEDVGELVEEFGSDLAEWESEQVTQFASRLLKTFGASLRQQIAEKEIPF